MRTLRLRANDTEHARALFALMAQVFGEECEPLGDEYLNRLLSRDDFWAIAAAVGDDLVGGITAHALPMTRTASSELFIYDMAVRADHQRKGVGRQLVSALREEAAAKGIREMFVPADDEDRHALDFYRALGGVPSSVTFFTFSTAQ
jgi:aminoglycoside 3-N-acetyltransferase I